VAGIRRADLQFSLSYDTNIKTAKEIVMQVMQSHSKVLETPNPSVSVRDLSDTAIHLSIKPWSKNADFGDMCSDILENCKEAFDTAGIVIQPYVRESSGE
jgi:small conductance mechanosensitive channel